MPVGAYGGRREIMEQIAPLGPVYQAGTLSAAIRWPMAAGLATLELIQAPGFHAELAVRTRQLTDGLQAAADEAGVAFAPMQSAACSVCSSPPEKSVTTRRRPPCDAELFKRFFHGMLERGVFLAPSAFEAGFMSSVHSARDIGDTLEAARGALREAKG